MGPVTGEISDCHGSAVIQERRNERAIKDTTYVRLMWNRRARHRMTDPSAQMTTSEPKLLPHCMLSEATDWEARKSMAQMPKLEGFQIWRPRKRSAYFEVMERRLQSAKGQKAGERRRIPTLMPVMYALAGCGHLRRKIRPSTISATMLVTMARSVFQ